MAVEGGPFIFFSQGPPTAALRHCLTAHLNTLSFVEECGYELGEEAFYNKDGSYYCAKDYLDNFGENCFKCREFLEGEVITALGNTFHLDCFTCGHCK